MNLPYQIHKKKRTAGRGGCLLQVREQACVFSIYKQRKRVGGEGVLRQPPWRNMFTCVRTCAYHLCAYNLAPMLTKSGCTTATVITHCAYLLTQLLNITCQLPIVLRLSLV